MCGLVRSVTRGIGVEVTVFGFRSSLLGRRHQDHRVRIVRGYSNLRCASVVPAALPPHPPAVSADLNAFLNSLLDLLQKVTEQLSKNSRTVILSAISVQDTEQFLGLHLFFVSTTCYQRHVLLRRLISKKSLRDAAFQ